MIWNAGYLPENWTIETLLGNHSSNPFNPDIANAFFRSGYIESWGRGISKMTNLCIEAGLPKPKFEYEGSGMWVVFQKDIYHYEYLQNLGLNDRQVKAVLFVKKNGKITNSDYQTLNSISKRTATTELTELVNKFNVLTKIGTSGSSIYYTIVGQK